MITIKHNELILRPITLKDFETILIWSQNETFCRTNGWELDRDRNELYSWWEGLVEKLPNNLIRLGIERQGKLIGYTDLTVMSKKTAELGIAIGETDLWGKSLGYQAVKLMIEYGNNHLGINTFIAETHETNLRSRKMLERIGFEHVSKMGTENYLGEDVRLMQYILRVST
ncbi:GNAT family N-acetyltransferase [Alkalibacterium sp. MB6]|uniref:GNAT family N-acetyltransferase n=1 Tax=Alkalibacterium sp. MB6 TaxID=2081965 RepID=UPI00192A2E69|nr:GNAT family N-acetyltransferase [Alkalibacterium sp. MB6]